MKFSFVGALLCLGLISNVTAAVWEVTPGREWTPKDEADFSRAVLEEYGESFCTARNLFSYCSATPYQIRAHYAWKHRLPFRVYNKKGAKPKSLIYFEKFDESVENYVDQGSSGPWDNIGKINSEKRLVSFLSHMAYAEMPHTSTIQYDTYPISFSAVRPGDIYLSRMMGEGSFHTMIVKKVLSNGLLEMIYTSVDDSPQELIRQYFVETDFPVCSNEGCGFRRFYPLQQEPVVSTSRRAVRKPAGSHDDYSTIDRMKERFISSGQDVFFVWMVSLLKKTDQAPPNLEDLLSERTIIYFMAYIEKRLYLTLLFDSEMKQSVREFREINSTMASFVDGYEQLTKNMNQIEGQLSTHSRDRRLLNNIKALLYFARTRGERNQLFKKLSAYKIRANLKPYNMKYEVEFNIGHILFFVWAQYQCGPLLLKVFSPEGFDEFHERWPVKNGTLDEFWDPQAFPHCMKQLNVSEEAFDG